MWRVLFFVGLVAVLAAPMALLGHTQPPTPVAPTATFVAPTATFRPIYSPTPTATQAVATVRARALNLRGCAGVDCPIVAVLVRGTEVQKTGPALKTQDGATWWPVNVLGGGPSGWVNAKYLEPISNLEGES